MADRIERTADVMQNVLGFTPNTGEGDDPEMMQMLQRFIFGEVFDTGNLDPKTRELITIVCLTTLQTLPQLRAHTNGALHAGVTPVEIREAIYQCSPFIGYPRTLNAIATINEVFTSRGIELPLPSQAAGPEETRAERGRAIQEPIYGNEIATNLSGLPGNIGAEVARFLTEVGFGDVASRSGLDTAQRELLVLCVLATQQAWTQFRAHVKGNLKVGNSLETLASAMLQCIPYVGFPAGLTALYTLQDVSRE